MHVAVVQPSRTSKRRIRNDIQYSITMYTKHGAAIMNENVFGYFQSFLIDMFFSLSFCITYKWTNNVSLGTLDRTASGQMADNAAYPI